MRALLLSAARARAAACDGFQPVEVPDLTEPPDGDADLGAPGDDLSPAADFSAATDLPADPDFPCRVAWTRPDGGAPGCAPRRVFTVESGLLDPKSLALARAGSGRLAFAYNAPMNADEAELHVTTVEDSLPSAAVTRKIVGSLGDRFGVRVDIAALPGAGSQAFHVVELALTDLGNEIRYRQLSSAGAFSPAEPVATGVTSASELALAVTPAGKLVVAYVDPGQTRLVSRERASNGTWSTPAIMKSGLSLDAPGAGQVSLSVDPNGIIHAGYHFSTTFALSQPRHASYDANGLWTDAKTLDNATLNGLSGYSITLATPSETAALLFAIDSTSPPATAQATLQLITFRSVLDMPTVEVLTRFGPADATAPRYRAALAADAQGLYHAAVITADAFGGSVLEYFRQIDAGGRRPWLVDLVDDDLLAADTAGLVDLVVDAGGRPHIAYYSSKTGQVRYATRLDR
jgi:hypothetical protein